MARRKTKKVHDNKKTRLWLAHRLEGEVKNVAIKPVRKTRKKGK